MNREYLFISHSTQGGCLLSREILNGWLWPKAETQPLFRAYFDKLRIARSRPSMVSGNMRLPSSCSIIWIDEV